MISIKKILRNKKEEKVTIKGWMLSNRGNNKVRFITVNDGSTFENVQLVIKGELATKTDSLRIGAAIIATGEVKITPNSKQPLEIIVFKVESKNASEDFPLQKQGMSMEVLRELTHVRHRTNLLRAVFSVRSTLIVEIYKFFEEEGFINVTTPIITSNDAEGAGEAFVIEQENDFFGKKALLGVTGQLYAEAFANGFGKVYTFGPTFRAEKSHTQKHASEFLMMEPELAFHDKEQVIRIADKMLKTIIKNTLAKHPEEFKFFSKNNDEKLLNKLDSFIKTELKTITYREAIEKLKNVSDNFENGDIKFGMDLSTEHERYIAEEMFKGPVAVTDYPKDIKAFYMKLNDDEKTVSAFDVLVPGIGELIGGSERETNYEKLLLRMKRLGIKQEELQWYLDLRKFGQYESCGFGLGFDRLLMYITGMKNIRDVIPFPRTPANIRI